MTTKLSAAEAAKAAKAKAAASKPKASKPAEKAAKEAEQEAAKVEREREKAEKQANSWLEKTAKTINVVVGKIEGYQGKSDDFRATLSVHLAEAEEVCKGNGIKFKEWAEENVKRKDGNSMSYGEVRRLVRIGQSDDPRAAIEDMRNKTAARVKKHSDAKKEEAAANAQAAEAAPVSTASADTVFEAFEKLSSKAQIAFLKKAGKALGLTIDKSGVALYPTASQRQKQ